MKRKVLVIGPAVVFSLAIMSWIIWSERSVSVGESNLSEPVSSVQSVSPTPTIDPDRVSQLQLEIETDPEDITSLLALANVYFEAHSFEEAIPWYEQVLALSSGDVESSTNLGVSYFYAGLPGRAVDQFQRSLEFAPDHLQTLLSLGIVRAFGLDDLDGAREAWERVIEVAPDSSQASAAREALTRVTAELEAARGVLTVPE